MYSLSSICRKLGFPPGILLPVPKLLAGAAFINEVNEGQTSYFRNLQSDSQTQQMLLYLWQSSL